MPLARVTAGPRLFLSSLVAGALALGLTGSRALVAQTAPVTVTLQLAAGADDVNEEATAFDASSSSVWLGNGSSATASYAGLRFIASIPRGATINAARLEINAAQTAWLTIAFEFGIENAGTSAPFSTSSRPSQRTLAAPRVAHVSDDQWLANTWYAFEDVAPLLQAIVNRSDWASGNALGLVLRGTGGAWGRKFVVSRDADATRAPRLVVTYTPTSSGDTTPPSVVSRSPAPSATQVATTANVTVSFNEAINQATLSFTLRDGANALVPASVSYNPATLTATLDPNAELRFWHTYTATVSAQDLAGNAMSPVSWTFSTAMTSFVDEVVGFTGLVDPTVVAFAADGRVYVAEKSGLIKMFDNLADTTPTTVADLRTNVHNFWDRGLLGMALHPSFPAVPYAYVLYTYDAAIGGTAPRWGTVGGTSDGCPTPPGATTNGCVVSGRLSRVNVLDADLQDEQVLVEDWFQQFPSHSIGTLIFGSDGGLYASAGDGASFNYADYGQTASSPPANDPVNEGGALRAQDLRSSGDPATLDGAVIRIDPETGAALPDNPAFGSSDPNVRRIVAYGLRNPFRITVRPGTRELWIGDVGWNTWEEVNRVPDAIDNAVENFGWPCYEGMGQTSGYTTLPLCQALYGAPPGTVTPPLYTYNHSAPVVTGETCGTGSSSISGMAFYTGTTYPVPYRGALFFADYSRSCIWAMLPGAGGLPDPANRVTIRAGAPGPVFLVAGPGGDIFYAGLNDDRIHRIRYIAGNQSPTAVIQASPTSGAAPLTVSFDGRGSTDPEGQPLTYAWDLDNDGAFDDGSSAQVTFTYTTTGSVIARLRVTDTQGAFGDAAVTITVNNTPPTAAISTPTASLTWRVGDIIAFAGSATDPQQGTLPASALFWELILNHCPSNCHQHTIQTFSGVASGSFAAPDHEYPSTLELRLTATDAGGLQNTTSVILNPQTVNLSFATVPAGLQLTVGSTAGTAPFARTVIIGSANSLSAAPTQQLAGRTYQFVSWSDGGAATHNIVAPATAQTYTATYREVSGLSISDVTVVEGNSGSTPAVFVVTLAPAATQVVTVQFATANGTATAGSDFTSVSGTLTFAPGQTSQPVTVSVLGDTTPEADETFSVILSNPTNATIVDGTGIGTITNDDTPTGPVTATFQVTASPDDVNEDGGTYSDSSSTIWLGTGSSTTTRTAGIRFTNVGIPRNATIVSARLQVTASQTEWIEVEFEFAGEASGNSLPFSSASRPSQRALLVPRVAHSSGEQWVANTWYTLEELAPILQALVTRADWNAGNALSLVLRGTGGTWGRKFVYSFEGNAPRAARLVVTYTP